VNAAGLASAVHAATNASEAVDLGAGLAGEKSALLRTFGTLAGVVYRSDQAEVARRRAHGMGWCTEIEMLDALMGLPAGLPISRNELTNGERTLVDRAPSGSIERRGGQVIRWAVAPVSVLFAVVAANDWHVGLRIGRMQGRRRLTLVSASACWWMPSWTCLSRHVHMCGSATRQHNGGSPRRRIGRLASTRTAPSRVGRRRPGRKLCPSSKGLGSFEYIRLVEPVVHSIVLGKGSVTSIAPPFRSVGEGWLTDQAADPLTPSMDSMGMGRCRVLLAEEGVQGPAAAGCAFGRSGVREPFG
jgi:hypothetical protein